MITKTQFEQAISWSYSPSPNDKAVNSIIKTHESNKSGLLEKMGDWILNYGKVSLEPTENDIESGYNLFLHDLRSFRWTIGYGDENKRTWELFDKAIELVQRNKEGFATNRIVHKEDGAGMKMTKAINLIFKETPLIGSEIAVMYSRRKPVQVTGELKMSIHGMDFLTMSENNYDWHSCMALDGEYAAGTLSYMCDKVTVLIYLDGSDGKLKQTPRCAEPWNDKKWRMVAYVDLEKEIVYLGGKQYPYQNPLLERIAVDKLIEVFSPSGRFVDLKEEKELDINIIMFNKGNHYNDFFFAPNRVSRNDLKIILPEGLSETSHSLSVGEDVPCLGCGSGEIEAPEDWTCYNCSNYYLCESCGEYVHEDDYYFSLEICTGCYEEDYVYCEYCGESYHEDDYDFEKECCCFCSENMEEDKED